MTTPNDGRRYRLAWYDGGQNEYGYYRFTENGIYDAADIMRDIRGPNWEPWIEHYVEDEWRVHDTCSERTWEAL